MNQDMPIAVLGAEGFIGKHVVSKLALNGFEVLAIDQLPGSQSDKKVVSIQADIFDSKRLEDILRTRKATVVVLLVGLPLVADCERDPALSFRLNVNSTQTVIEAMRRVCVNKIIFASTAAVYGYGHRDPVSESSHLAPNCVYAFHKVIAEQILKTYSERYGMNTILLRLFNVYGGPPSGKDILSEFIRSAKAHKPIRITGPRKYRDFVHIDDVAEAFLRCCNGRASNLIMNIGSGERLTLSQLARLVGERATRLKIIEEVGPDDGSGVEADISFARRQINFHPTEPLTGIRKFVETSLASD